MAVTISGTSGITIPATASNQSGAVAWANFNGTNSSGSSTIRASYNISSITATGTGSYTVTFTNALVDANYCVVASLSSGGSGGDPTTIAVFTPTGSTYGAGSSSSFQMFGYVRGVQNYGAPSVCFAVYR